VFERIAQSLLQCIGKGGWLDYSELTGQSCLESANVINTYHCPGHRAGFGGIITNIEFSACDRRREGDGPRSVVAAHDIASGHASHRHNVCSDRVFLAAMA
jgi:hypothetical protein